MMAHTKEHFSTKPVNPLSNKRTHMHKHISKGQQVHDQMQWQGKCEVALYSLCLHKNQLRPSKLGAGFCAEEILQSLMLHRHHVFNKMLSTEFLKTFNGSGQFSSQNLTGTRNAIGTRNVCGTNLPLSQKTIKKNFHFVDFKHDHCL